jgi:intracellular sulfur oxidation DsrE/DsrF family protein
LCVDHNSWSSEDKSPDADSKVKLVADVDEEDNQWKIELRVYNNYNTKCWMGELAEHITKTPLCRVGLPGTHDSGTYAFDKTKGASPDSDLTETIQEKLDRGRLLGKLNDFILRLVFERLCQCQDKTIQEQLELGIRYLDLRVARHKEEGTFWTCHGVYCVNMTQVMQEINDFLTENPKVSIVVVEAAGGCTTVYQTVQNQPETRMTHYVCTYVCMYSL